MTYRETDEDFRSVKKLVHQAVREEQRRRPRFGGIVTEIDEADTTALIFSGERTFLAFANQPKCRLKPGQWVTFTVNAQRAEDVQVEEP
jgi:hypothetical protein